MIMTSLIVKILIFQLIISILIIKISKRLNLLDIPNTRKVHKFLVPYTGGIIISFTFLFVVYITNFNIDYLNLILSTSFLIAISGFIDDRYNLNPGTKLVLQFFPIYLLVDQNLILNDLGSYEYLGLLSLGSFNKVFTIICCLLLINACNYSDGIDGLLVSIILIILLSFSIFLFFIGKIDLIKYLITIKIILIFFLIFNFELIKNFKIFLGDSGSNVLGYLISFLTICLYTNEGIHPVYVIWPLAYLIFEFLTVNLIRILNNKKIFLAGNDHFHYILSKKFKNNFYYSLIIICLINIFFSLIGIFSFLYLNKLTTFIAYIISFIIYYFIRKILLKK